MRQYANGSADGADKFTATFTGNSNLGTSTYVINTTNMATLTQEGDGTSGFDVATGRFTPKKAGWYCIGAYLTASSLDGATDRLQSVIRKNGLGVLILEGDYPENTFSRCSGQCHVYLDGDTDYVDINVTSVLNDAAWILKGSADSMIYGFRV